MFGRLQQRRADVHPMQARRYEYGGRHGRRRGRDQRANGALGKGGTHRRHEWCPRGPLRQDVRPTRMRAYAASTHTAKCGQGSSEWQAQGATFELTSLDVIVGHRGLRPRPATAIHNNSPSNWTSAYDLPSACVRSVAGGLSRDTPAVARYTSSSSYGATVKDLDGPMHIVRSDDVVSYEHDEPLQHIGSRNLREVVLARRIKAASGATLALQPALVERGCRDEVLPRHAGALEQAGPIR
ncbi:MAG: hypothetical protein QOE61_1515 [Micromonosporaceae bacterium]|nr:hypothetical protein [Micromonosporaceae bacterium]